MKHGQTSSQLIGALTDHVGFWMRQVSNHVSQRFTAKVETFGVTVSEWVILRVMFDSEVTSPSALASATGLTRGAVSKLVERLRAKDLLTRVEALGDRRFQDVSLTAVGRALVPKLAALTDQNDEECFAELDGGERERLVATLKRLVEVNRLNKIPME